MFWSPPSFDLAQSAVGQVDVQREHRRPHLEEEELGVAAVFGDDTDACGTLRLRTVEIHQITRLRDLQCQKDQEVMFGDAKK